MCFSILPSGSKIEATIAMPHTESVGVFQYPTERIED
jgi:hypothetical protein